MKKTLVFHIGTHRTATSSLQQFLFQNRNELRQDGVLYPFQVRRHVDLINQLFQQKQSVAEVSAQIMEQMQAPEQQLVVLSDEDICMRRDLTLLGQFREYFDVKVVFCLRRQDLWLESWFLQNIKWQWDPELSHGTFDAFMAQRDRFHWIDYDAYLHHLEMVFGRENIVVNLFEKQQMPQGPIQMFCDSIGVQMRPALKQPQMINQSLSPVMSEFLRHVPLDKASPRYRRVLIRACAKVDKRLHPAGKASSLLMPHELRQQVYSIYEAGNQAVAQRYLGRDQLFLDPLPQADAALAEQQLPQETDVLMEKFVAPLFAELAAVDAQPQGHKREASTPSLFRRFLRKFGG